MVLRATACQSLRMWMHVYLSMGGEIGACRCTFFCACVCACFSVCVPCGTKASHLWEVNEWITGCAS